MNVTDQLDRQLRATNVAKLGMRLSCVETRPQAVPRGGGNTPRPTSQPY